jgi:hypothetical protein
MLASSAAIALAARSASSSAAELRYPLLIRRGDCGDADTDADMRVGLDRTRSSGPGPSAL